MPLYLRMRVFVKGYAGMKFLPLIYVLYVVTACGSAEVEQDNQQDKITAIGLGGGYPIAYLGEPLRLTDDGEKYEANVETLNATSYRYAVVMTKWLQRRELAATVLSDPKFVDKLVKSVGDALIARIVQDKATMEKVKSIALQMYKNPQVRERILSGLTPAERKDLEKDLVALVSGGGGVDQKKLFDTMVKLSKNNAFMTSLLSTLAMNGDFLTDVLAVGEEESLLAEILDEEFINELIASGKEGDLLSRIIKLDVAVKQMEVSMQRLLADEETLRKILVPSSFKAAQDLMNAMLGKIKELGAAILTNDVNYLRKQIATLFEDMSEQKQLIAIIFSEILFEAAFIAYHPSFCEEDSTEWTTVRDIDGELLIDNLGDEGLAVLCLIAIDDGGNEQPAPTVEPVEPTEPTEQPEPAEPTEPEDPIPPVPILKLGGNLPEHGSSSALRSLKVKVSATTNTLAGYRWLLLRRGGDCPFNPDVYDTHIHALPMPITTELKLAGPKTLCVFGVNQDGVLATPIASHKWELLIVRGTARLEISGSTQDLYFGDYKEIVLRNVGDEGMFWHIFSPDDIDWLEIRKETGEWISLRHASTQKQLVRGAMLAHSIQRLQLRVVGTVDEMREAVLYAKHIDSDATFPIKLKLHSGKPRLTIQNQNVDLTPEKSSTWIGIVNTNEEGTLRWKVRHVFHVDRIGINVTETREDRIDDDGWHVGAGSIKVEMLFRPRPTTAKIQVFIFEFRGGKIIPVAVTYLPPGWRHAD